jgi:MFS family permease
MIFVVFYGIYAGGYNALLPTTITEVYGVQHYASVNAFIYFVRGIGAIFGAPVAGVMLGSHKRSGYYAGEVSLVSIAKAKYKDVVVFDTVLLVMAAVCMGAVRWLDARDKRVWRWKA